MKKKSFLNEALEKLKKSFSPGTEEKWKIFALCLAGATIFWFFNALNKEYSARIRYPVSFVYNDSATILVEPLPEAVRLEVTGGGWDLLRKTFWFNIDPVTIPLPEPTVTKALTPRTLRPVLTDQIAGIRIDEILTDSIRINIEEKVSRMAPVMVDSAKIRLATDRRIVSPVRLSSDSIVITGPKSQVNAVGNALTLSLRNEVIDTDYVEQIDVSAYLPPKVSAEPSSIEVTFSVQQFVSVEKELHIKPVNFPTDSSVILADTTITASILVARRDVERLKSVAFQVVADYNQVNKQDSTVTLDIVEFPDFVAEIALNNEKIRVNYERKR